MKLSNTVSDTELSELINTCVYDRHGNIFGRIVELILNLRNGSISHFVLEAGEDKAVLPWKLLTFDRNKKAFALCKDINSNTEEEEGAQVFSSIAKTPPNSQEKNKNSKFNKLGNQRTQYFFAAGERLH